MRVYLNLILLMLLVTISASTYAQSNKEVDVTLSSGTIYHGVIYEEMKDSIRLLTEEDHILKIPRSEIVSIEKKPNRRSEWIRVQDSKRSFYFTTNFCTTVSRLDELMKGAEIYGGIRHHKRWQNGLGIGVNRTIGYSYRDRFTGQIGIQNRINALPFGSTPFISYEPKFVFALSANNQPDLITYKPFAQSFEIGYRFYSVKKNSSFNVSLALQQHIGRYVYYSDVIIGPNNPAIGEWENVFNAFLKLGFQL